MGRRPRRRATRVTGIAGALVLLLVTSPATLALVLAVARFPFVFFFAAAIVVPVLFLVFAAPVAGFVFMRVRQAGAWAGNQEAGHGRAGAEQISHGDLSVAFGNAELNRPRGRE